MIEIEIPYLSMWGGCTCKGKGGRGWRGWGVGPRPPCETRPLSSTWSGTEMSSSCVMFQWFYVYLNTPKNLKSLRLCMQVDICWKKHLFKFIRYYNFERNIKLAKKKFSSLCFCILLSNVKNMHLFLSDLLPYVAERNFAYLPFSRDGNETFHF